MEYCYNIRWKEEERKNKLPIKKMEKRLYLSSVPCIYKAIMFILRHVKKIKWKIKLVMLNVLSIQNYVNTPLFHVSIRLEKKDSDIKRWPHKLFSKQKIDKNELEKKLEQDTKTGMETVSKYEGNNNRSSLLDGVIELPFTKSDIDDIGVEGLKKCIGKIKSRMAKERHILEEQIHFLASDRELKKVCGKNMDCTWLLKQLLFCDILEKIQLETHIDISKVKIGVLDGGNGITEYLIKLLVNRCNFLTIFTEREVYFEEMRDYIYMEEGLMIDLEKAEEEPLGQIDILIDVCRKGYHWYKYLKEDAVIAAMFANVENMEGIIAKRGKRKTIYDVEVDIFHSVQEEDISIFMEALYWKNWKAAYMIEQFMKDANLQEVKELCNDYGIVLRDIKCI